MVRHLPLLPAAPLFPLQRLRQLRGGERRATPPPGHRRPARGIGASPAGSGPRPAPGAVLAPPECWQPCTWRGGLCVSCCGRDPGWAGAGPPHPAPARPRPRPTSLAAGSGPVLSVSHVMLLRSGSTAGSCCGPTIWHRELCSGPCVPSAGRAHTRRPMATDGCCARCTAGAGTVW